MKPAKELTEEEIAPALAEAQGWVARNDVWYSRTRPYRAMYCVYASYLSPDVYSPLDNNFQFLDLTLNPEIHAGMIDVLDWWFSDKTPAMKEVWKNGQRIAQHVKTLEWYNANEYLQNIRLWQMRAVVEYLRRRK